MSSIPQYQDSTSLVDESTVLTVDNEHGSDYGDFGSDAEELAIVEQLLAQLTSQKDEDASFIVTDIEDCEPPRGVRLPKVLGLEYTRSQVILNPQSSQVRNESEEQSQPPPPIESVPDSRPPLERFRKPPKKALSVTDLVSPAWCELQYFYTLSKHGRKRRTPAMKQGSKVHQALEDEVHVTVPVEITKFEDSWGLRVWNIIQGLRTLRETGKTRELEIWGTVGGEIVNGIIDEISYECPDPGLEERLKNIDERQRDIMPEYQSSITDFLISAAQKEGGQSISKAMTGTRQRKPETPEKRVYITDIKTRTSQTLPTGSSTRPTIIQLHLYHHMLENLAQGNFALTQLADRYGFDVNETFSDSFLAQVGNLNQDLYDAAVSSQEASTLPKSTQDSMDILLQHNTLSSLWEYMLSNFRETLLLSAHDQYTHTSTPKSTPQSVSDIPSPNLLPTRLSPILTAEYLAPTYNHIPGTQKKALGKKTFVFNADFLKSYLEDSLTWWRGERPAKGVELAEAWKCRSCDFRDDCEWIHERDAAALQQVLDRKKMREVAGVEGKSPSKSKV